MEKWAFTHLDESVRKEGMMKVSRIDMLVFFAPATHSHSNLLHQNIEAPMQECRKEISVNLPTSTIKPLV